jgi:Fe-S-cluster containining protein
MMNPFYADGLRFSCTACSTCCRYEPGYVFLSSDDTAVLSALKEVSPEMFIKMYCRWVFWPDGNSGTEERLSLRERTDAENHSRDCIFWRGACTVYEARPLQCRTYPFWSSLLASQAVWQENMRDCPGIGRGEWHSADEIETLLALERRHNILTRKAGGSWD